MWKKMRSADGVISVENEDESNTITSGPESGERKPRVIRSEEARTRKTAKYNQRLRARKASISGSQNMIETAKAEEEKETDESGKWEDSTEYSHGLT